ncbi:MAG: CopG family transcriptional regulator [Rubrobacteraceae bacterium]
MVRKQLYISDEHERALKARARELGVSEAELVRRMLDGLLLDGEGGSGLARAGAAEALESFLAEAEQLAGSHRFPEGYRFDRDELYEDRA